MVVAVGNEEVAVAADEDRGRRVEFGSGGGVAVSRKTGCAAAGDGGDDPRRIDLADAMVAGIGDVEVAAAVGADGGRRVELGGDGGVAVSRKTGRAAAGDSGDASDGMDAADAMVARIGNVDGVSRGDEEAGWSVQNGFRAVPEPGGDGLPPGGNWEQG